jgi:hypothetical protein
MDYADDQCRDHFTLGQVTRMHWYMQTYMPTLYSMNYLWRCVAKNNPDDAASVGTCKSACFRTPSPKGTDPISGWCFLHGSNPLLWGECICPGSINYPSLVANTTAPTLAQTACNPLSGMCAVALWTVSGQPPNPLDWMSSNQRCLDMGYRLCNKKEGYHDFVTDSIVDTPCAAFEEVWTGVSCGPKTPNKRIVVNLVTETFSCKHISTKLPSICCYNKKTNNW